MRLHGPIVKPNDERRGSRWHPLCTHCWQSSPGRRGMLHTIAIFLLENAIVALLPAIGLSTTPTSLRATWAAGGA